MSQNTIPLALAGEFDGVLEADTLDQVPRRLALATIIFARQSFPIGLFASHFDTPPPISGHGNAICCVTGKYASRVPKAPSPKGLSENPGCPIPAHPHILRTAGSARHLSAK